MNYKILIAALLAAAVVHAETPLAPIPPGWNVMGNGGPLVLPGECELGVDAQMAASGEPNFSVRCTNDKVPSSGGLVKAMETSRFRGKRVRYSAMFKGAGISDVNSVARGLVEGQAALFLMVGTPKGFRSDRTDWRIFKGTTGWEQIEIVVDVPADNSYMYTGFYMNGKGQLWVRDVKIEEVPLSVPTNFRWEDPKRPPPGPDLSLE